MIAIIDYGVGNLFSLTASLNYIGADSVVTGNREDIIKADRIILPGVGAFEDAIKKLYDTGLVDTIRSETEKGKPLLGICLGMQLLFDESYEYGIHKGLGFIPGSIVSMEESFRSNGIKNLKVPHIGWNSLSFNEDEPLFKYIKQGSHVYYVHSFYGENCEENTIGTSEYGVKITGAVKKDKIYGTQFHPEKSGGTGLNILKAFLEV